MQGKRWADAESSSGRAGVDSCHGKIEGFRIIKDDGKHIATGCVAGPTETKPPREAEQALGDYIAQK
jgi:hypothetical protein